MQDVIENETKIKLLKRFTDDSGLTTATLIQREQGEFVITHNLKVSIYLDGTRAKYHFCRKVGTL